MNHHYNNNSYDAVLSRIEEQLRVIRENQEHNKSLLCSALKRISALEAWKLWIYGVAAGISAIVTLAIAAVKWIISIKSGH